jgi:serine/threonine protein kinase
MSFIELFEAGKRVGQFDLPRSVTGVGGHEFDLRGSAKGGGNGVVFRASPRGTLAEHDEIDQCALKFLRQLDPTRVDRFNNERRILSELDHPRIVQYFDHGDISLAGHAVPWIAMELGESNLKRHVLEKGPLSTSSLKAVGAQLCEALVHLHERGFIHRDLKPDNFVWDGEVEGDIKMIDFGLAKRIGEDVSARPLDQCTQHQEFVGPVFFSSPELVAYSMDKSQKVDERSDLFQIGKVLWFLGTGVISAGIPARRKCPLDGRLHAVVYQLLNDDPSERLQTAAEVATAIHDL